MGLTGEFLWLMWLSLCLLTGVHPLPHPFMLPCCLPKPLSAPQGLHGPFPFIPSPARPGLNLSELRESALNANGWPLKSPAGWDVNHHSGWSLFAGDMQTEIREKEKRLGKDTEWRQRNKWTIFLPQISQTFCLFLKCLLLTACDFKYTDFAYIYWDGLWCLFLKKKYW